MPMIPYPVRLTIIIKGQCSSIWDEEVHGEWRRSIDSVTSLWPSTSPSIRSLFLNEVCFYRPLRPSLSQNELMSRNKIGKVDSLGQHFSLTGMNCSSPNLAVSETVYPGLGRLKP